MCRLRPCPLQGGPAHRPHRPFGRPVRRLALLARLQRTKLAFDLRHFLVGALFEIDKPVAGGIKGAQELVQLEVQGAGVPVLGMLDKEDHQKGNDGRAGIDDELPRIRKAEDGPVTAHARTMAQAPANAMGEPAKFEVCFAMSAKLRLVFCSCCIAL